MLNQTILGRLARFAERAAKSPLAGSPLAGALPSLNGLAGRLPQGNALPDLAPALRDMLARLPALGNAAPLCGAAGGPAPAVPVPEGARFAPLAAGGLDGLLYVPARPAAGPRPLVVMLHGCTQSPEDFALGTGMNAVAEEEGFLVLYPRQTRGANPQGCWNWFRPGDQRRDAGEPALIAGLARAALAAEGGDPSRVFVAGLSAGGAAAAVLGQLYPDLFAAVGVHSGLAAGAADGLPGALAAMRGGAAGRPGRAVPTIVFHGDADRTVSAANGEAVAAQARGGLDLVIASERGRAGGGLAYTRTVESAPDGAPALECWVLHGAGHAWSGGSPAGSYTEPRGPDASRAMARFFRERALAAGA